MDTCLRIAEEIYKKIENRNGFLGNNSKDMSLFLIEFKREIRNTDIKCKYEFNSLKELIEQIEKHNSKTLDLSLIPSRHQKDEFILWLAVIFESLTDKIVVDSFQEKPTLEPKSLLLDNSEATTTYLRI
ncbi:hypothetical protein [Acinetobacter radioresistens]|uniref:hypothetical protein n=1 Tax=Acinetobacter radioresistens TaxID=40216 RepID=UPI00094621DD|nr:hypothetical protein [Acinetobacter radioresistens]